MSEKITLDELGDSITAVVASLGEEARKTAEDVLKRNAEMICDQIPKTTAFNSSMSGTIHLKDSFVVNEDTDTNGNKKFVIQASTSGHKYSLVHLIENGHKSMIPVRAGGGKYRMKNNGEVRPHPFLAPLVAAYSPIVHDDMIKSLNEIRDDRIKK